MLIMDDLVEELNALTRWQVIVATNDVNALMSRVTEIRNKINNQRWWASTADD